MSVSFDKIPPQNLEAEQSVLGAMMLDADAVSVVEGILRPDDFYRDAHRVIYEVIISLHERNEPIDIITVTDELRRRNALDKVGGVAYITLLADSVPSTASAEYYAKIVVEKALLRGLISISSRISSKSYEGNIEVTDLIDEAERMIVELSQRGVGQPFAPVHDILLETFDRLQRLYERKSSITGVPTYFTDLDRLLAGLQPSELILLAARPGMGKTSFALNIAQNAAIRQRVPVAIFSLEMSKEQLVQRMLCGEAMIDQNRLRTGQLLESDWTKLVEAVGPLSEAPIYIDDTPAISVAEMRAKTRRLKAEKGLGLVVVDYLQLMQGPRRAENRQQEISEISRSLKSLARELNVPILALSQLSRAVEQTQEKRPNLSHLRESGALEQDSDVVMFIYRHDYYFPESEKKNIAEIIVAKHRHGPVGTVELAFLKEYTKFFNLAKEPG
ncbi:MAG: replicative DNA helicase [Firmicutes bacterium]|nr:replicative DNA helicase [Bacillota bacterium]